MVFEAPDGSLGLILLLLGQIWSQNGGTKWVTKVPLKGLKNFEGLFFNKLKNAVSQGAYFKNIGKISFITDSKINYDLYNKGEPICRKSINVILKMKIYKPIKFDWLRCRIISRKPTNKFCLIKIF